MLLVPGRRPKPHRFGLLWLLCSLGAACGPDLLEEEEVDVVNQSLGSTGFSAADALAAKAAVSARLRDKLFVTTDELKAIYGSAEQWDHHWNGSAWPNSLYLPYKDWWDLPHGDDDIKYLDPDNNCGYHYNHPRPGLMTVDTIKTQKSSPCPLTNLEQRPARSMTAPILRRDPMLDFSGGLTFEFRLRIIPHNRKVQSDAVFFQYVGRLGNIGLAFSWDCLKAGPVSFPLNMEVASHRDFRFNCNSSGAFTATRTDNTDELHTYRVVLKPQSLAFDVYKDGVLLMRGTGNNSKYAYRLPPGQPNPGPGFSEYDEAYVLLGDTHNEKDPATWNQTIADGLDVSGAFELDFVRYRRGAYPPSESIPFNRTRAVPLLARNPLLINGTYNGLHFKRDTLAQRAALAVAAQQASGANDPLEGPIKPYGPLVEQLTTYDRTQYPYVPAADGAAIRFTKGDSDAPNRRGAYYLRRPRGIKGDKAWQLSLTARTLPAHTTRSFSVMVHDQRGAIELVLSPGKVELRQGKTYQGWSAPVLLDTTKFHTYTLVRRDDALEASLYIDRLAQPAIAGIKLDLSQLNNGHGSGEASGNEMQINLGHSYGMQYDDPAKHYDVEVDSLLWRNLD